jgi:hypothetical protein
MIMITDARKRRDDDEDEPGDEVIEDGRGVRVRMTAMDGVQRGIFMRDVYRFDDSASLRDARARARGARNEMIERASNAWRTPGTRYVETPRPTSVADANAMRRSAYQQYCRRISDAWRNPVGVNLHRDGAEPDQGTRFHRVSPEEFAAAHNNRRTESAEDLRRAALAERDQALQNAWKTPTGQLYPTRANPSWRNPTGQGDPRRATEIERQRQRWHGGR